MWQKGKRDLISSFFLIFLLFFGLGLLLNRFGHARSGPKSRMGMRLGMAMAMGNGLLSSFGAWPGLNALVKVIGKWPKVLLLGWPLQMSCNFLVYYIEKHEQHISNCYVFHVIENYIRIKQRP